jgi:hypothetical protein
MMVADIEGWDISVQANPLSDIRVKEGERRR